MVDMEHINNTATRHHAAAPLSSEERAALIQAAAQQLPETFGLRAFTGDTFRVNLSSSYLTETNRVMLYTDILKGDKWLSFAKGTLSELKEELIPAPPPSAAPWLGGDAMKAPPLVLVDAFGEPPISQPIQDGERFAAGTLRVNPSGSVCRAYVGKGGAQAWKRITNVGGTKLLAGAARFARVVTVGGAQ